jgi:hypothetical protein
MHGNNIKCNFILPIPLLQLYYPNKKLTIVVSSVTEDNRYNEKYRRIEG